VCPSLQNIFPYSIYWALKTPFRIGLFEKKLFFYFDIGILIQTNLVDVKLHQKIDDPLIYSTAICSENISAKRL
jgi:hypothetical protein